ncbi:MAG: MFS transporter [Deltaproteobacteria bacterium]|nr:MFS transporter [Deltaproteobacteria bacterium]
MASAPTVNDDRPFGVRLRQDLNALVRGPRELWLLFALKFLESVAHFAIYNLLAVYLSEDLHYGDQQAGIIAGTWLTAVSIVMFFSGFIADVMGIRKAMLLAVSSVLVGRTMMAVLHDPVLPLVGLGISTWGVASMIPTMTAGVRRYTTKDTVSFGFSLFYVIMNVGALVAPLLVGSLRGWLKAGLDFDLLGLHAHFSTSQLVFSVASAVTALSGVLALGLTGEPAVDKDAPPKNNSLLAVLKDVAGERAFWGFMLFVSLLVLVRLIFQHAHLTWPKYTQREISPDFNFAFYWAINPAMIILLTPLVTALTRRLPAFWCIVTGSLITTASVFFLAASSAVWAQVAFIVTLSLGETLWSPRLYEYTATVAPPGREASYMGLSQVPMFVAKPVVGWMSGWMLATWCPDTGPRDAQFMWLIIGLTTLVGPLAIVGLKKAIETGKNSPGNAATAAA